LPEKSDRPTSLYNPDDELTELFGYFKKVAGKDKVMTRAEWMKGFEKKVKLTRDGKAMEVEDVETLFNSSGIDYDYETVSLHECVPGVSDPRDREHLPSTNATLPRVQVHVPDDQHSKHGLREEAQVRLRHVRQGQERQIGEGRDPRDADQTHEPHRRRAPRTVSLCWTRATPLARTHCTVCI
jgi:hypothetical protein